MNSKPSVRWVGMPHTRYHALWRLMTWQPHGILDDALLDEMADFTETQELITELPFNRFVDLSQLTQIRLQIGHIFTYAHRRREVHAGLVPVKTAIFCDKVVGFGIARMYETLMEGSSIHVCAFRERAAAALWLGVPVEVLGQ